MKRLLLASILLAGQSAIGQELDSLQVSEPQYEKDTSEMVVDSAQPEAIKEAVQMGDTLFTDTPLESWTSSDTVFIKETVYDTVFMAPVEEEKIKKQIRNQDIGRHHGS